MTDEQKQLLEQPVPDCERYLPKSIQNGRCSFVSGDPNLKRLVVRYWSRPSDQHFFGSAYFGPHAEGPPGHAHGGSIAALLDEAMGLCAWSAGHMVLAAELHVRFLRSLPLNSVVHVHAWMEETKGRRIAIRGELRGQNQERFADSSGEFAVISGARLLELKQVYGEI